MFATQTGLDVFRKLAIVQLKYNAIIKAQNRLLPDQVIAIYKSPGRTSMLAQLFGVSTTVIAQIKGQTGEYQHITRRLCHREQQRLLRGGYYEKVVQF